MTKEFAAALALTALKKAGLDDWQFMFDEHPTRVSSVRMKRKLITLSERTLRLNGSVVVQHLNHSICHALTGNFGHGKEFLREARLRDTAVADCTPLPQEYEAVCQCGAVFYRLKEPKPQNWIHDGCRGKLVFA